MKTLLFSTVAYFFFYFFGFGFMGFDEKVICAVENRVSV